MSATGIVISPYESQIAQQSWKLAGVPAHDTFEMSKLSAIAKYRF